MDGHACGGPKATDIRQIVRLKELLQKWQKATLGQKRHNNPSSTTDTKTRGHGKGGNGISPAISRRLIRDSNLQCCNSDEDGCQSPESPCDVPKGYLAIYVGPGHEVQSFIVPASYLTDPLFKKLLEKVEEVFGFDHSGALSISCEFETFYVPS